MQIVRLGWAVFSLGVSDQGSCSKACNVATGDYGCSPRIGTNSHILFKEKKKHTHKKRTLRRNVKNESKLDVCAISGGYSLRQKFESHSTSDKISPSPVAVLPQYIGCFSEAAERDERISGGLTKITVL